MKDMVDGADETHLNKADDPTFDMYVDLMKAVPSNRNVVSVYSPELGMFFADVRGSVMFHLEKALQGSFQRLKVVKNSTSCRFAKHSRRERMSHAWCSFAIGIIVKITSHRGKVTHR